MTSDRLVRSAALALSLAGCAAQTTTEFVNYETPGTRELFQYAAAGRDFRTVIYGNPTKAAKETFDTAVIAAMQGRNWGAPTHFTTTPSENAREGYRVVLVFSGDRHYGGAAACRDIDPAALATVSDRVELQAAFCFRDRLLSNVHVGVAAFSSPDDARLDQAVAQAVLHLFPLRDPDRRPQGDREFKFL